MLSPLPRRSDWVPTSLTSPAVSAFPGLGAGSACASSFSRLAQRSLTLRPAHSRGHQFVTRFTRGFNHFVTSIVAPVASGWSGCRVGLSPTGKSAALPRRTLKSGHSDFSGKHRASYRKLAARALRLYEQERGKPDGLPRLGEYVRRWSGWVRAGLPTVEVRGVSGPGLAASLGGAAFCLGAFLGLGGAGFLDVEVQEFHG